LNGSIFSNFSNCVKIDFAQKSKFSQIFLKFFQQICFP